MYTIGGSDYLLLDNVKVYDHSNGKITTLVNKHHTRLSTDAKGDKGVERLTLCTAVDTKLETKKEHKYKVVVTTSTEKYSETNDKIFAQLIGSHSSTAVHQLDNPAKRDFLRGATDEFIVTGKGCDIGPIECVTLGVSGKDYLLVKQVKVLDGVKWKTFYNKDNTRLSQDESAKGDNGRPFLTLCA